MIVSAADYRFVDFQNGDLPIGNFDGGVMPLRPAVTQTPGVFTQKVLKAEDISFLYEGMRDKIGAMMGATINGTQVDEHVHPGTARRPRNNISSGLPTAIPLTKSIKSSQMVDLCYYLADSAASGGTGVRFLDTSLAEIPVYWSDIGRLPYRAVLPPIVTGVSPLKADMAKFAVGQPVDSQPILDLFDDMKLFTKPIWFVGEVFSYHLTDSCFTIVGSGPDDTKPSVVRSLRYMMQSASDPAYAYNDYAWREVFNPTEVLAIPLELVKDPIKLWMRFGATNQVIVGDSGMTWDSFTGLIDVTRFFNPLDNNGMRHYAMTPTSSVALMQYIESLRGWTELSPTYGVRQYQFINVTYIGDFIFEFTPNGRTQWW